MALNEALTAVNKYLPELTKAIIQSLPIYIVNGQDPLGLKGFIHLDYDYGKQWFVKGGFDSAGHGVPLHQTDLSHVIWCINEYAKGPQYTSVTEEKWYRIQKNTIIKHIK